MRDSWAEVLGDGREVVFTIWPVPQKEQSAAGSQLLHRPGEDQHFARGLIEGEPIETPMLFNVAPKREVVERNFWERRTRR